MAGICAFCNVQVLERQMAYEDEHVAILVDHKPVLDGHALVIPKRHVERFDQLNDQEVLHIHKAVSNLAAAVEKTKQASSYMLLQKNGESAGQSVPHMHIHFFPRKDNDMSDLGAYVRFYLKSFSSPLGDEQLESHRQELAEALHAVQQPLQAVI